MEDFDYDLFVIGAGSGGVRAARMAAARGVRVAIAEERYYGGTCVNVGCVPKKLFVYAAHFQEDFRAARGYGWQVQTPDFDWQSLLSNKDSEITRLQGVYQSLLEHSGVTLIDGRAVVSGAQAVRVGEQVLTAERILIATGSWPSVPDFPGKEYALTSNEVFHLRQLPEQALIVGGGYIAVEFASILNGLGVDVSLSYRGPLFLRGFDQDIREFLAASMADKGIKLLFNTQVAAMEADGDGYRVSLDDGSELDTGAALFATGRVPNTAHLGLDNAGVALDESGAVIVDRHYRSTVESIYALGDVTNRITLTPVAIAEAMALIDHLYGNGSDGQKRVDYQNIPTAVFSQPNIGSVGLTEKQARKHYPHVDVYRSDFKSMKHSISGLQERTLMKMLVDRDSDKVLGIHMVGDEAGEILQGMAVAMRAGATKKTFDSTIGIHPTVAEEFVSMREAVND